MLESKYLISAPAPLGRILNYIKRIKEGNYKTSFRGPNGRDNLDNWTVCFMVGLGLVKKPTSEPTLKISLTNKGNKIYRMIRNLPDFPDSPRKSRANMLLIKQQLKDNNQKLYKTLRKIFLESDTVQNLLIFLEKENKEQLNKQKFYKKYSRIFGVEHAGFNRLPSLIQIAEFCDILRDEGKTIRVVSGVRIMNPIEQVEEHIKENKRKEGKKGELEIEEKDFLDDIGIKVTPNKRTVIVQQIERSAKICRRLKELYGNKCQICGFTFAKKDGGFYSEVHHLIPLGRKGSDRVSNMVVLCPNCHKQMHYAKVELIKKGRKRMLIKINNKEKYIKFHPVHLRAVRDEDLSQSLS